MKIKRKACILPMQNEIILRKTGFPGVLLQVTNMKWQAAGYVARMNEITV